MAAVETPPPGFATRSEFARVMGVSAAAVTHWGKANRIVFSADGKFVDVERSKALLKSTGGSPRGGAHRDGSPGGAAEVGPVSGPPPGSLLEARTALAKAQVRRVETEAALRAGQLVERSRYAKGLKEAIAPILAELANVSSLRGADLAAETDVRKVQIMLDDALNGVRRDIAAALLKFAEGPPPAAAR